MMRLRSLPCLVIGVFLLLAAPAMSDPLTPEQKDAVQQLIRDYLKSHPEAVMEALKAAQQQEDARSAERVRTVIAAEHNALFADPASPVGGNPDGDVTLVEFFDYQCPYCKEIEPALESLLASDRKLRLVYKEYPILGPSSVFAAQAALAARAQGKYEAFHRAMMAATGTIDDEAVRRTAAAIGLDPASVAAAKASPEFERIIKRNLDLATRLEIEGTPTFVIGDQFVPGVVELDTLRRLIEEMRERG